VPTASIPCSRQKDNGLRTSTRAWATSEARIPSYVLPMRPLHLPVERWPFLAPFLVNSASQYGQTAFVVIPFSRWWRRRLLKVENWRPLYPWSKQRGFGREVKFFTEGSRDVAGRRGDLRMLLLIELTGYLFLFKIMHRLCC
jgi:hypothetical protein